MKTLHDSCTDSRALRAEYCIVGIQYSYLVIIIICWLLYWWFCVCRIMCL